MIAIDTNVILRFLTRQPKAQFEVSRELFRQGGLFVSTPVVMEVYFTLTGSVLEFSADHALEALEQGVPFKDACVLAFSAEASCLVTFDKPFAKRATSLNLRPVVRLP